MHPLTASALTAIPLLGMLLAGAAPAAAEPPRPGCGYGDANHAHQAAPGQDPLGLRPGNGFGDKNLEDNENRHTAPPGQAPENGGNQSGPMRGCKADPRP